MARPKKQTIDYFPHSVNHKNTMYILEQRFGNDGYAFWFKLLETLGDTNGHYLDLNDDMRWEFLQAKTRLSSSSCTEILDLLAKLDAIDRELWNENKVVWCQNLVDNVSDVYANRRASTPERPSFYTEKPRVDGVSTGENPQSKVKESKVKESIYIDIFDHWNGQGVKTHRARTSGMEKAIDTALKEHSDDEIKTAITNYAIIQKGSEYWFNYAWTLQDFLSRNKADNIERFLDLEIAKQNFKNGGNGHGTNRQGARELPTSYTPPELL